MSQEEVEIALKIRQDLDKMYWANRFDEVNQMLVNMKVEDCKVIELISYLASTRLRYVRSKLPYREEFYRKVERVLMDRGRKDIKELLNGLK